MSKKNFENKCFAPNWIEIDLADVEKRQTVKEVRNLIDAEESAESHMANKEASLESRRRKDLNTLLKELDEIKQNIEKAAEKQHRLANLMRLYTGNFAQ